MISSMRRHSQLTVEMRAEADMELEQRRDSLMTEQDATRVSRRSRVHSSDNFFIPNATGRRRSSFSDETADFLKRLRSHFWSSKDGPEADTSSPLDALFGSEQTPEALSGSGIASGFSSGYSASRLRPRSNNRTAYQA